ncbi:MAG: arsinothricin resistance N-acetyltransferase ArsN1 family B [Longimicrobiales bacterium]
MSPRIRLATPADAPAVRAIYRPIVEETAISFEFEVPSEAEVTRRISAALERAPWLLCEERDEVLGYAYAVPFRARAAYAWSVESSVYVDASHQRRGVARGLYLSLLGCLREQGFHRLVAGITLPNPASVALHERLGFEPVGSFRDVGNKFDAWHAVGFWELKLQPLSGTPAWPLSVEEASGRDGFSAALLAGSEGIR